MEYDDRNSKTDPVFNGGPWGKKTLSEMDVALWCYEWDGMGISEQCKFSVPTFNLHTLYAVLKSSSTE